MAILQMMPEWLWPRTNLRQGTKVSLQGRFKGDANHTLEVVRASTSYYRRSKHEQQADIKVPVITLAADGVENWANLLTARGPKPAAGVILNPIAQRMTIQAQRRRQQKAKQTNSAAYKVQAFRGSSSPISRRLASLLAASPAITLPIIRVIQETLLPRSQQVHVAEVLLGGILRPQPEPSPGTNPEEVQYEFIDPGMRAELLAQAPVKDTTEVLSRYIEDNFDISLENFIVDLRRLLRTESTEAEGLKPIAIIAAEVLQYRGLKYAEFVQEVKDHYQLTPDTEEIPSPDLQTLIFQTARLIESDPAPATPELEPFSFTIATLQRQPGPGQKQSQSWWGRLRQSAQPTPDWVIQRQSGQAYRYVETLPDQSSLELVAIPGGSFMMGQTEAEKAELIRQVGEEDYKTYYARELPQHEVTVPPFFMGRYPVTQAQWRAVASLPQVERELNPDPSNFKGDRRPVEQVNWFDAMEFCARLSAHTHRTYTLPSEAQWEYACRSGTTSPFYFGRTLTTDLANYNGNYTYADGPKGEYREQTTPVDHFPYANAWGLSDMHGNVWEWCLDHYHDSYAGAPRDGSAWVDAEAKEDKSRIRRGGSWGNIPRLCRCAYRIDYGPGFRSDGIGFRVVSVPPRALG
jgi:formylglycine-generating enzyme required for sulfatase activity